MSNRNDCLVQKLISEGVDKDSLILQREKYQNCTQCNILFNESDLPQLLKCGHVCCKGCLNDKICIECKKPKDLRTNDYKSLLDLNPKDKSERYNFSISVNTKKAKLLMNQKDTIKIKEIFQSHPDFEGISKDRKFTVLLIIVGKNFQYRKVMDKTIKEINQENPKLLTSDQNGLNLIMIHNRQLGGTLL